MKTKLADLPEEVRKLIAPHMAEDNETLSAIGLAISKRRDEAKTARTSSGIETIWKECEEAYIGIDNANRHEFQDARWAKPMSMDGPVTTGKTPQQTEHKSTAYVRLNARYVDAGSAKLGEILVPADDKAFSFSETPLPELIKAKDNTSQVVHEQLGPLTRPAMPGEAVPPVEALSPPPVLPPTASAIGGAVPVPGAVGAAAPVPGQPPAPPQVPLTVKDLAEENIAIARKAAKAAERRIYDWMIECQRSAEVRKVIADAARIGVGVLKAPIPETKKVMAYKLVNGAKKLVIQEKINPASKWADPWNIFPDPACGENIHNGDWIFERDFLSPRQVRDLKSLPGYISRQIDYVLEEGPDKVNTDADSARPNVGSNKGRFTVWYYYGSLKREEMSAVWLAAGKKLDELKALSPDQKEVYAIVTMINDHVVRATINPLDSGNFPYHSMPWSRRAGHWAGIGVGEQVRMPQKMINAATRAMLNNAGKSAGGQIVIDRSGIKPADGSWVITPDKIWYKTDDATGDSVSDAFEIHEIKNVTDQLMKINEYALKLAEESTSIPLITQGMSGPTQPETLGATNLQNNNANQLLRSIGYAFDDYITEPEVRQYYEWLLLDPDVPDDEKGDFTINAHGSAALVERAIQDQTIASMGPLTTNPVYGVDPKKWMKLFLKSKRLDPEDVQYTEEQQAKIDAAPPVEAPAVQVAKIKAATDDKKLVAENAVAHSQLELDGQSVIVEHVQKLHDMQERRELAMLEYANRNNISLLDAKKQLADTAMKLQAQKELNEQDHAVDLHKHHNPGPVMEPPVQIPGRAAPGHAFDQSAPK